MAATFQWGEANGAGETLTLDRAEANFKNVDDSTTAYSSSPIPVNENSYEKWIFGKFSGAFNQILNGKFDHTAGVLAANLTVKGAKTMTADGDRLTYATPSKTANANLTKDFTTVNASFPTGANVVYFGATGPATSGKAASMATNPCFTNYLALQLQIGAAAVPGDTTQITMTLQYDEN